MNNPEYINKPDAIVAAAWDGLADLVQRLIDSGADINIQDETGQTALIAASDQGYFGIVELLLKRGADSNIKDKDGDSALGIARFKDHAEIVKLLVAHGTEGKNGPSAKEQTWDQIYDGFEGANAVKKLVSEIGKKKKKDNRTT
jgi:ankyrin repeat protein